MHLYAFVQAAVFKAKTEFHTTGSWDQIQPDQQRPHLREQNLTDQTSNIKRCWKHGAMTGYGFMERAGQKIRIKLDWELGGRESVCVCVCERERGEERERRERERERERGRESGFGGVFERERERDSVVVC